MNTYILEESQSILNNFIAEIRDTEIQKDSMRFRRNIERIGEILALEVSKTLDYTKENIETPLGVKEMNVIKNQPVICSVLRAGLPLHQGFLNYFDKAENAFISAYRHHPNNNAEFEIVTEYIATPSLENKTLILVDPMLATGRSLVSVAEVLQQFGNPKEIHVACVIASKDGVDLVEKNFPPNTKLWIAALDDELNNKGYIIPGLGDAGDLSYGSKL